MRNSLYSLLLTCVLAVLPAHAAEVMAPDVLAKTVTEDVLASLRASKEINAGDLGKAAELIEIKILPHFNFPTMTRLVMGRHWAQATSEQRRALTSEFRTLLVRTYTASLTLYRDQTIDYRPLKLKPQDTDVIVKSSNVGAIKVGLRLGPERLGDLRRLTGDLQASSEAYQTALGSAPGARDAARLHHKIAGVHQTQGHLPEAEKEVEAGGKTIWSVDDEQGLAPFVF